MVQEVGNLNFLMPYREQLLLQIPLFCKVEPMARPRLARNRGVYQPLAAQHVIVAEIQKLQAKRTLSQPVFVDHYIYRERNPRHKGMSAVYPCYGDLDNMVKTVNDALVRADILADDRYIVGSQSFKAIAKEDYCHVLIWSVAATMEEFDVFSA